MRHNQSIHKLFNYSFIFIQGIFKSNPKIDPNSIAETGSRLGHLYRGNCLHSAFTIEITTHSVVSVYQQTKCSGQKATLKVPSDNALPDVHTTNLSRKN